MDQKRQKKPDTARSSRQQQATFSLSLSFAFAASPSCQVPGKTRMDPGRAIVPFILKGKKKKKTGVESQSKHVFYYYLLFSSFDPLFLGFLKKAELEV